MALKELPSALRRLAVQDTRSITSLVRNGRRYASTEAAGKDASRDLQDLESRTSYSPMTVAADEKADGYDPVKRVQQRRRQLPASRYQYKSPRYFRGPLHPHQPPPKSDPASREFVPGPFNYTRLEQTYQSMIAPDLMAMAYVHKPPGTPTVQKAERLRTWDDSSPYHKGRPKRGPRGPGEVLRLVEKDIHWRNIPKIEEVTVHSMVKGAIDDSAHLHIAGMLLQAVTGVRPTVHKAKHSVAQFGIRESMPIALTCTIRGDMAYEFVDKCINLVFPRIKDWPGIKGTTGDSSGNISWGFNREGAILFPEVEINYDMYPPKMIPGFHVTVKTSATSDRHARLLLSAMGVPFYGKLVD
ncbi:probable 50S ribosomal protein L5 [Phialocephala subalpina]|uniref:Large ribosomal subunit protein uL5m n=1 Tax=Phialocephala subalpina TaxID=576137 RepID=A0A1L7X1T6_9HELO|nr:probable 50S ribosomal protein L5 [Phialocephala subalpina]